MKRFLEKLTRYTAPLLAAIVLAAGSYPTDAAARTDAPDPDSADKTLSPYFFVKSEDPSVDQLPLKSTSAVASISGVIADVVVTQVYKNEGKKPLEALYVFPASTRAAVYGMKMTIGERTIVARIEKRDEARKAYEKAREEGRSASLLEQQRPNVFQMNVANIMPGDEIRTELRYTELLTPTDGVYELIYPTVVGPRYSNKPADAAPASERWSQNPYLHEGDSVPYTFDIKASVSTGVPIQEISCPSHKVNIGYRDRTHATVELDPSEKAGGNRDFILKYRLTGTQIESGMLLYEGEKENFFLLMVQPTREVSPDSVPPREYVFVMDVSGSMHGYPIAISKKLLKDLASGLRPQDRFNVLLFAGGSQLFSEKSVPADQGNIERAVQFIERPDGSGGTELLPALQRALAVPRSEGMSRTVVIATDGYVTVEPEIFDLIRQNLGDVNFFPFGIGTSVNRHLIEGMARVGLGEPFVITKPDEAPFKAEKFRQYVQHPLLTHIQLKIAKLEAYDVEPPAVPDLFAERPVVVFGKWKGKAQGTINISGMSGKRRFEKVIDLSAIKPGAENSALRQLWARSSTARLSDYNGLKVSDDRVRQITDLGLEYSLLTAYTSFVAVDSEVRRKGGEAQTVHQPLPLPEGVSDLAVGNAAPAMTMALSPAPSRMREDRSLRKDKALEQSELPESKGAGPGKVEQPPTSNIVIDKLSVGAGLSEEAVKRMLEQHSSELASCFPEGKPAAQLKITLKWTIGADGAVSNVEVVSAPAGMRHLSECFKKIMAGWKFPPPTGAGKVAVTALLSIAP